MDDNTETVQEKPRTINDLIDLPYSEMTEDEIALVVEFKANIKARDAEHETVKILAAEHLERMRDITLLVVVGHGVDRYGVYALCV